MGRRWIHGCARSCGSGSAGVGVRGEVQKVHGSSRARLGGGILARQVAAATSRTRLDLLALYPGLCTSLTSVGDTAGSRGRVYAASLDVFAIIIVVGAVSLQEISSPKGFPADLNEYMALALEC